MKATSEALPSTYHQFTFGTGCSITGRIALEKPIRSSSQAQAWRRNCIGSARDRERVGQDLDLTVGDARVVLEERVRRRPAGDPAVGVVDAAVARAEEELGVGQPVDRAAEVSAIDSEGCE